MARTGKSNYRWPKIVNASPGVYLSSGRERVAALEHYLIGPSSQISRESYQQTRLIAIEPPRNWRAALELGTNFGPRPGATNRYSKPWQNLDSKILSREHLVRLDLATAAEAAVKTVIRQDLTFRFQYSVYRRHEIRIYSQCF